LPGDDETQPYSTAVLFPTVTFAIVFSPSCCPRADVDAAGRHALACSSHDRPASYFFYGYYWNWRFVPCDRDLHVLNQIWAR